MPCTATAEDILTLAPDGIVFSPGPGDPALLDYLVGTVSSLMGKVPMLGICLGHQVIGRAFGARTYKLKFGHRGANHPVKDLLGPSAHHIQNHGYALEARTF
jgi:carbamoyl-phosphate synthase small subunit